VRHKLEHAVIDRHLPHFRFPDLPDFEISGHPRLVNAADDEYERGGLHFAVGGATFHERTARQRGRIAVAGGVEVESGPDGADPFLHGNLSTNDPSVFFFHSDQSGVRKEIDTVKIEQTEYFGTQRGRRQIDVAAAALDQGFPAGVEPFGEGAGKTFHGNHGLFREAGNRAQPSADGDAAGFAEIFDHANRETVFRRGSSGGNSGNSGSTGNSGSDTKPDTGSSGENSGNSGSADNEMPRVPYEPAEVSYQDYLDMSAAEQQAFIMTFSDPADFFAWLNEGKAAYEAANPSIEIDGSGSIDIGDLIGKDNDGN